MGRGLSDYNVLSTAGGILGGMFGGPAGAAAGSSLGSLAEGDDFGEAMMGGMMSFGVGTALQGLSGTASSFTGAGDATAYATDAAAQTAATDAYTTGLGDVMPGLQKNALAKQYLTTKPYEDAVAKNLGQEGITSNMFRPTDTGTFGNIGKGIEEAGFGKFASRAIKNPKVYTGLGMAGLGLAGQMEPPELEAPEKKTYAARAPNLTTGPARAQNAPSAEYAYGYGPEFDYGFAGGGLIPMHNIADMGLGIERVGPAPQRGGGGSGPIGELLYRSNLIKETGAAPQRGGGGILNMAALAQANPDMFSRVTEDEDEDRRFARSGIVSGNRKYANGNLIDQATGKVSRAFDQTINPRNTGEAIGSLGTAVSLGSTLANKFPGVGTALGALGAGFSATQYQNDLTSRGINTNNPISPTMIDPFTGEVRDTLESDHPNFIRGAEGMLNSATFGLLGQSPREQYDAIIQRAKGMTGYNKKPADTADAGNTDDAGNEIIFSKGSPQVGVTTSNLAPVDGDDENDGMGGPNIDLNAMTNLPSVEQLSIDQQRARGGTPLPYLSPENVQMANDLAIQNAVANDARANTPLDTGLTAVMSGDGLSPDQAWGNVSADAISDPGFGEEGMGSSWAQGGLVPGSMNEPQKRYFGIYKQGGPVRSYALGENVEAIQAEQVQQNPIVVEAVAAITGNHPEPEKAIMQFVNIYGEEALVALRDEIIAEASSEQRQASGLGALSGPGTGLSDDIPAEVQQGGLSEPAALSVGEQVVPADVVAMLGDGSTEAGSKRLDGMVDEVRMQKTGTKQQAGPLDTNKMTALMA